MSEAVGMNETFIHQFIKKGTPKYLSEEVRHKLAKVIGVSEELLRGRDLHVQPIETTPAANGNGRTDLEDMWAIWNTATPEERRLIVDLAKQVVGRIRSDGADMSEPDPIRKLTAERARRPTFLKEWRKHWKLTLEVASERAGMSTANLSAMERGTQGYTQAGLEALAQVYECEPGHLLAIDPSEQKQPATDASLLSRDPSDNEDIWSIWNKAQPSERELIINVAAAILKTRKGD